MTTPYSEMSIEELIALSHQSIVLHPWDAPRSIDGVLALRRAARDAILDLAESLESEGWCVVPREPTEDMWRAADRYDTSVGGWGGEAALIYDAMISASPAPTQKRGE